MMIPSSAVAKLKTDAADPRRRVKNVTVEHIGYFRVAWNEGALRKVQAFDSLEDANAFARKIRG